MKKIAGRYTSLIIVGIIFVLWNILVWTLSDLKDANVFFYCGYGFTCLAFLLMAGVFFFYKLDKNVIFSVLMPAYLLTLLYFAVTFIMDLIFMINLTGTNAKAVVIPNIIVVMLYAVAMVVAYFAVSRIGGNNKVIDQKVAALKLAAVQVGQIAAITQDADVKCSLSELREMVEYSDPMGVEGTAAMETEFSNKLSEIRMLVEEGYAKDLILQKIKTAQNKLRERNEILRALK